MTSLNNSSLLFFLLKKLKQVSRRKLMLKARKLSKPFSNIYMEFPEMYYTHVQMVEQFLSLT